MYVEQQQLNSFHGGIHEMGLEKNFLPTSFFFCNFEFYHLRLFSVDAVELIAVSLLPDGDQIL